jgi:hypothetical protein
MIHDDANSQGAEEILERLEASRIGPTQREALRLVLAGSGFTEAAEAVGLRSTAKLRHHAKRLGIKPPVRRPFVQWAASNGEPTGELVTDALTPPRSAESEQLVGEWRQAAGLSVRELIRRLKSAPEKLSTRDLTAAAGAATEKIRAWEQWDRAERADTAKDSQLGELLQRLTSAVSTVTVGVKVEASHRRRLAPLVDATPAACCPSLRLADEP